MTLIYIIDMKICILYRVPDGTIKYTRWHDGFTKAISILQKTYAFFRV